MNSDNTINIDHLIKWVGRSEQITDKLTPELVKRFQATFSGDESRGQQQLAGIQWCLGQPAVVKSKLGDDGHPAKGGFLPPVPLPRRMWASSKINVFNSIPLDQDIIRTSVVSDVVLKQGKSGPLVFVYVDHEYDSGGTSLLSEIQTIVYRQHATYVKAPPVKPLTAATEKQLVPDSPLLFRYSALTFNAHRIHYDHDYATLVEGYPGRVVHGPLIATLLMHLAQSMRPETELSEFKFRAVAPTFVDQPLHLFLLGQEQGSLEARNAGGGVVMKASAKFKQDKSA